MPIARSAEDVLLGEAIDIQDILEATTAEVAEAMASPNPDSPIQKRIMEAFGAAQSGQTSTTLDSILSYIAAARGLHEASARASDPEWASFLHAVAQDFLSFATSDIGCLIVLARHDIANAGLPKGTLH